MAKFCPHCGKATVKVMDGGRLRDACPAGHLPSMPEHRWALAR